MRHCLHAPADARKRASLGHGGPAAVLAAICGSLLLACGPQAQSPAPQTHSTPDGQRPDLGGEWLLSDVYNAHRGEWTLASGDPLYIPTELVAPGQEASELARANRDRMLEVRLPGGSFPALPAGTVVRGLRGAIGRGEQAGQLNLDRLPETGPAAWPGEPPKAGGALRVASLNLLNYFNGDGRGGGFPTERGARSPEEFEAQGDRLRAAFAAMDPGLLAVQELENDGFGPHSAARSLAGLLNAADHDDWAVIDPGTGPVGGDVITVGLFYRESVLEPVGGAKILQELPFRGLSRQPLAQRFRERASGSEFWVIVNHLKSKGGCPETGPNRDQDDGQGCWNAARTNAVRALAAWLDELATGSGTPRILVLGDMNAWRQEDPIRAFREAGYLEAVEERSGLPQYSYRYFGQRGTLDYAFASPALLPHARRAFIWHINADMPRNMDLPRPWLRASDHDPVIVDLDFSQSATSD